jgi:tetratricopeptide (TPR) repeat protein
MTQLLILGLALAMVPAGFCTQQSATGQSKPAAKRPAQAKTQAEFKDYNAAYATTGGAAMEKAANDFSAKYPSSELTAYLYAKALHEYQNENNAGKMLAMGEKVLSIDPDNSIALVLTATVLSDSLSDSAMDRQEKVAEIRKNANHALETINTSLVPPANANPEQIAAYKSTLQSMALSALGITDLKLNDNARAETELKTAAELNKMQPDPYIWYHLALSQDHQMKYQEALASINEALRYAAANPDLDKLAKGEHERLLQLRRADQKQPNNSVAPH